MLAVLAFESAAKIGMQTRRKGHYKAEVTFSPRFYVKPLVSAITATCSQTPSDTQRMNIQNNVTCKGIFISVKERIAATFVL